MLSWKNETCSTCVYYDDRMFKCKENHRTWTNFDDNACEYWDVPHIVFDKKEGVAKSVMPWELESDEEKRGNMILTKGCRTFESKNYYNALLIGGDYL